MQQDWNYSIVTLIDKRATRPPAFKYNAEVHKQLFSAMSDASDLYVPETPTYIDKGVSAIQICGKEEKTSIADPSTRIRKSVGGSATAPDNSKIRMTAGPPAHPDQHKSLSHVLKVNKPTASTNITEIQRESRQSEKIEAIEVLMVKQGTIDPKEDT